MKGFGALVIVVSVAIVWTDNAAYSQHIDRLIAQMTLEEKVSLLHGSNGVYCGNTPQIERLGIPALTLNDGPQGYRVTVKQYTNSSTAWPAALHIAASWNRSLGEQFGTAMGEEFKGKGSNVLLGPAMNVARIPVNGRNFEYISGEDPYLGAQMVYHVVRGIQSQGIIANAKHFINNNQETNRLFTDSIIDDRTQFEIYLPPFEAAVQAGVLSVMCSYNKINGHYACENNQTLNAVLKENLGFKGFVVSDWGADHSTVNSVKSGLDQEMPSNYYLGKALIQAVHNRTLTENDVDSMVRRILFAMESVGMLDDSYENYGNISKNVTNEDHNLLARQFGIEGIVLLQNSGVLPLKSDVKLAVLGNTAYDDVIISGGGSGHVDPPYIISPLTAILEKSKASYVPTDRIDDAVEAAKEADVAIIFTGTTSTEGRDRANLSLPDAELRLIDRVTAVQENVVVVVVTPGAILLPFSDKVKGILVLFMPGQEYGNALVDVLYGDYNPSGRLPVTFPNVENEVEFTKSQYPGKNLSVVYMEKLEIGYRWYGARNKKPAFSFGHGLSYTKFAYSNLTINSSWIVSFDVKNSGYVAGSEVPQLYLTFPTEAGEPCSILKGFTKIFLDPGETRAIQFSLSERDRSIWDPVLQDWIVKPGTYQVNIGASSEDIRLSVFARFKE